MFFYSGTQILTCFSYATALALRKIYLVDCSSPAVCFTGNLPYSIFIVLKTLFFDCFVDAQRSPAGVEIPVLHCH